MIKLIILSMIGSTELNFAVFLLRNTNPTEDKKQICIVI